MTTHPADPGAIAPKADVSRFLDPLWNHRWLIALIVILGTGGTFLLSSSRADQYQATAKVLIETGAVREALGLVNPGYSRSTANEAQLIQSLPVAELAARELKGNSSAKGPLPSVQASAEEGGVIGVTATAPSGAGAARTANAFVAQYIALRADQTRGELDRAIKSTNKRISLLPGGSAAARERQALRASIVQLASARALASSQARELEPATAPGAPAAPKPLRDALFAFVISALLAVALAFGLERFDQRLKRPQQAEAAFGVPLLSLIPHISDASERTESGERIAPELREPFRWLRTSIDLIAPGKTSSRVLLIMSAGKDEGKSTVVRNLALAYYEWGNSVCVVEADLRQPSLSERFGIVASDIGVTSVLSGESKLDDALVEINADVAGAELLERIRAGSPNGAVGDNSAANHSGKLSLLPAGAPPPNPQAVIGSSIDLVSKLRDEFDVVIIDTPPALVVGDAFPLVGHADGVVAVGWNGHTTSGAAKRLIAELNRAPGASVVGFVLNDIKSGPRYGYGYEYGYEYGYGKEYARTP